MAYVLVLPRFDYLVVDGTIAAWLKGDGDEVRKGEPLYEVETQKATQQVTAPRSGYLGILAPVGTFLAAGEPVGVLATSREELERDLAEQKARALARAAEQSAALAAESAASTAAPFRDAAGQRVSRRAKILAEKHGVDLSALAGTGPGGRIMPEDVLRFREGAEVSAASPTLSARKRVARLMPLSGIRRTIAQRMQASLQTAAQVTNMVEADATGLVRAREALAADSERESGLKIDYNDLLVALCARVLREYPMLNSSLDGEDIKVWENVNVGLAVNTAEGLMVPVVHDADRKSLVEIHVRLAQLIEMCHGHTIALEEVSGGTFTISNVGMLGIDYGTPILNPPEAAIIAVGRLVERPVVRDGAIAIRTMVGLSLTFDHRIVDGAYACGFLARLSDLLRDPLAYVAIQLEDGTNGSEPEP